MAEEDEGSSAEAIVGISIAIVGSVFGNFGVNFQKYSFMNEAEKPSHLRRPYAKQPRWWFGMIMVVVGALSNFAAFALAPQSVIAPIGALVLVWNLLFAHFWLGESLTCRDITGTSTIVASVVLIVAFGSQKSKDLTLDEIRQRYSAPEVWAYFGVAGFIAFVYYSSQFKASNVLVYEARKVARDLQKHQRKQVSDSKCRYGVTSANRRSSSSLVADEWIRLEGDETLSGSGHHSNHKGESENGLNRSESGFGSQTGSNDAVLPVGNDSTEGNDERKHFLKGKNQVHVSRYGLPNFSTLNDMGHRRVLKVYNWCCKHLCCCFKDFPSFSRLTYDFQSFFGVFRTEPSDDGAILLTDERVTELIHNPPEKYKPYAKLHPLGLAGLAGVIGAQNTLFAKTVGESIKTSMEGDNQMEEPVLYAFVAALFSSIIIQQHFLARSLEIFDALYVVPVFQAHFILTGIISGGINFQEFSDFDSINYIMFPIGVAILITGIMFLSQRKMRRPKRERNELEEKYNFRHYIFHTDYQGSLNVLPVVAPIDRCTDGQPPASPWDDLNSEYNIFPQSTSNRNLDVGSSVDVISSPKIRRTKSDSLLHSSDSPLQPSAEFLKELQEAYYEDRREKARKGEITADASGISSETPISGPMRMVRQSLALDVAERRPPTARPIQATSASRPRASTANPRRSWLWLYDRNLPNTLLMGGASNRPPRVRGSTASAIMNTDDVVVSVQPIEEGDVKEDDQDEASEGTFWESVGAGLSFLNASDYAVAGTRASGPDGLDQYKRMRREQLRHSNRMKRRSVL